MKKIRISLPQGDAGSMAQGCAKKLGLLVLSIVAVLALLGPSRAAADQSSPVTQLQFLQMLVGALIITQRKFYKTLPLKAKSKFADKFFYILLHQKRG